ncbi:LSU ribosomal protein L10AE [Thermoplasmatales archaeon SCGC AB-539-N05]|nr:LSU ribosomal protein L10AE [Thermoplasmatales archaeon SCGC AB-539-N05]
MSRKPSSMYRAVTQQSNTRREYMGGVPLSRIAQFDMGDKKTKFSLQLSLVVDEKCQIRDRALEAARIAANREMEKKTGKLGYRLKIRVYPHNVLRENKQATGAGADRVSQGMRSAFGKTVGTAARVVPSQKIMTVETSKQHLVPAKNALRKAGMKIPVPCRINIDKDV